MGYFKKCVSITILGVILLGCHQQLILTNSPSNASFGGHSFVSPHSTLTGALPSPLAGTAVVTGKIVRDLFTHREPLADTKILLANVIKSEDGTPIVAAASEETSPVALTGKDGSFVFTNINPGIYSIVIVTPIGLFLIQDKSGNNFIFTAQPGMIVDLGEILTTLPY